MNEFYRHTKLKREEHQKNNINLKIHLYFITALHSTIQPHFVKTYPGPYLLSSV